MERCGDEETFVSVEIFFLNAIALWRSKLELLTLVLV